MTGGVDITVLMPVYNRATLLGQSIGSILAQRTTAKYEIVVVDDCSTDASAHVAESLGARVVRTERNVGCGGARNIGVDHVAGDWIAFLDSDDWWCRDHLETLVANSDGVGFVATSALTRTGRRLRVMGSPYPRVLELARPSDVLAPENVVAISAAMVRTDLIRRAGGFPDRRYADDLDLWTRVLAFAPGRVLPDLTVAYRSHPGQVSADPAMVSSVAAFFRELAEKGVLAGTRLQAVESAQSWDDRGNRGVRGIVSDLMAGRAHPVGLGWVLAARAGQRHRWRLQHRRAREIERSLRLAG